jgi:hypothetical protein
MHGMRWAALVIACVACAACGSHAPAPSRPPPAPPPVVKPPEPPVAATNNLRGPADFASIADPAARSRALFGELAIVLMHPRCVNCHTPDESPRQGDHAALHDPPIVRSEGGRGVVGMQCTGCHQDRNLELARVPGAPNWRLAPIAMVWLDRTPAQICAQLKDPKRSGRTLEKIQDHIAHDPLVAWGWAPGADRVPAPGSQALAGSLARAWIDTGAECP